MANTYTAIATTTVGSGGASEIIFTSIPQTYTDLRLLCSIRNNLTGPIYGGLTHQFNGGGHGNVYNFLKLIGTGAGVYTGLDNNLSYGNIADTNTNSSTANFFASVDWYIPTYTNNTNKTYISSYVLENNGSEAYLGMASAQWRNTSAITSIRIYDSTGGMGGGFREHSTATLYGIKNS